MKIGTIVRTTPQYESIYWGERMEGEVVHYDPQKRIVTFLFNGGKVMLNEYWLTFLTPVRRATTIMRLHDGLRDMVDGGRLTESMIPDDWQWLTEELYGAGHDDAIEDIRCASPPGASCATAPIQI